MTKASPDVAIDVVLVAAPLADAGDRSFRWWQVAASAAETGRTRLMVRTILVGAPAAAFTGTIGATAAAATLSSTRAIPIAKDRVGRS